MLNYEEHFAFPKTNTNNSNRSIILLFSVINERKKCNTEKTYFNLKYLKNFEEDLSLSYPSPVVRLIRHWWSVVTHSVRFQRVRGRACVVHIYFKRFAVVVNETGVGDNVRPFTRHVSGAETGQSFGDTLDPGSRSNAHVTTAMGPIVVRA